MANENFIPGRFQQPFFNQFDHDGVYRGSFPLAWIAEKHGLSLDIVYNVAEGIKAQLHSQPMSIWSRNATRDLYANGTGNATAYGDIFTVVFEWVTRNGQQ